jgi:hypothetical protein
VPGENHINSNELSGLPGTTNLEKYSRHQAKHVVRSHTRKKDNWMPGWLGHGGRDSVNKSQKKRRNRDSGIDIEKDTDSDVEAIAANSTSSGRGMGGVLSALLTLYDRNQSMLTFSTTPTARSSLDDLGPTPETTNNTLKNANIDLPEKPWLHRRVQYPPIPLSDSAKHAPSAQTQSGMNTSSPKRPGYRLSRYGFSEYRLNVLILIYIFRFRFSFEGHPQTRGALNIIPTIHRPSGMHFSEAASAPSSPPSSGSRTPSEGLSTGSATQSYGGGKHKLAGMLAHANHSFHSLKSSIGNNLGTKSTPSSETGTPTNEGEEWERRMMKEREKAREKRRKDEKRRKKKRESFVSCICFPFGRMFI